MGRRLYVGNLPYKATDEDLTSLFSRAGAVDNVRVMRDQATGRARGFAFVEMVNDEDAQKAIQEFHQFEYRRPGAGRERGAPEGVGRLRRRWRRRPWRLRRRRWRRRTPGTSLVSSTLQVQSSKSGAMAASSEKCSRPTGRSRGRTRMPEPLGSDERPTATVNSSTANRAPGNPEPGNPEPIIPCDPDRHVRLQLPGVEGQLLSRGSAGREDAAVLRRPVRHGGDQLHVLPDADAEAGGRLVRAGARAGSASR